MTHPSLLETLCPGSTTLLISYYSVKNYCLSWPPSFSFVCPFVSKTPSYLLIYHLYVSSAVWKAFQPDRAVFFVLFCFFQFQDYISSFMPVSLPWYNRTGWLGVKRYYAYNSSELVQLSCVSVTPYTMQNGGFWNIHCVSVMPYTMQNSGFWKMHCVLVMPSQSKIVDSERCIVF